MISPVRGGGGYLFFTGHPIELIDKFALIKENSLKIYWWGGGRGEATSLIFVLVRPGGELGASRSEVLGRGLWIGDSHSLRFLLYLCPCG